MQMPSGKKRSKFLIEQSVEASCNEDPYSQEMQTPDWGASKKRARRDYGESNQK